MQNGGQFVVNIVPLTNILSNISGLDQNAALTSAVENIQQMVNFDKKTVYTDYLGSFTGGNINVLNPLNLCNVGITSNGIPSTDNTNVVGTTTSFINFFDTVQPLQTAMKMSVGNNAVMQFSGTGNGLVYNANATEFRVSSMTFYADTADIGTMNVRGTCYAQQFLTLSDERAKRNISLSDMTNIAEKLENVNIYSYKYADSDTDQIGLLAQELEGLFPECVDTRGSQKFVKYNSVVALLLGAVKSLAARVAVLEELRNCAVAS